MGDIRALASAHISAFEKRRILLKKVSKSKKARRVLSRYSKRNKAGKHSGGKCEG